MRPNFLALVCLLVLSFLGAMLMLAMNSCRGSLEERNMSVVRTLGGSLGAVNTIGLTPTGDKIAAGTDLFGIRVWDIRSGRQLQQFARLQDNTTGKVRPDYSNVVKSIAFVDAEKLLVGGPKKFELWNLKEGKLQKSFDGLEGMVDAIAVSPDGRQALSGTGFKIENNAMVRGECLIRLWNVESGQELRRFEGHIGPIIALAFLPDGKRFLSLSTDNTMRLWNAETGEELQRDGKPKRPMDLANEIRSKESLTVTKDGKYVLRGLTIWDIEAWKPKLSLGERLRPGELNLSTTFSPDESRILATHPDGTIRLWDIATKTEIARAYAFRNRSTKIYAVAITPDGCYGISAGDGWVGGFSGGPGPAQDSAIRIWKLPK